MKRSSINLNDEDLKIIQEIKDHYKERGIELDTTSVINYCIRTTYQFDPALNKKTT